MKHSETARKVRAQIERFSGIFSPHISKPKARFIAEMLFGIQASQDTKLSEISRALDEGIALKKTEERLCRHLATEGMDILINEQVVKHASRCVHQDTLIVVDPTDIRKRYARRMQYLARIRDGSTGQLCDGYWGCVAVACEPRSRRVIPIHQRLWSSKAPDFISENEQLLQIITMTAKATNKRGIYVMDRGGDRNKLYNPLLDLQLRFIMRLVGSRHLLFRGRARVASELAAGCPMAYAETIVKEEHSEERIYRIEYGFRRVKLPGRKAQLYLVVIKGFGQEPILLLTNVAVKKTRQSLEFIVQAYTARWLVEETIRFIKQSYRLENMRSLKYQRLRNMTALVLAAAYFSARWLGRSIKLSILSTHVLKAAKRFFGIPDFHYYALADGIARLLSRLPYTAKSPPHPESHSQHSQLLLPITP